MQTISKLLILTVLIRLLGLSVTKEQSLSGKSASGQTSADTTYTTEDLFDKRTKPQLISKQFSFTEGPAVDKSGNIYFTDQPNNAIWKYDIAGKLSLFAQNVGRSNGMYFDKKGNLITCADEHNELWQITPDKKINILLRNFQGYRFNGPNDLWIDAGGGIYFTDPLYERPYWNGAKPDIPGERVYYLPPGKHEPLIVTDKLKKPNGIVGTPDGSWLYIADIDGNKTYKFTINKDGTLSNQQLFTERGSDGMTLDNKGNLYLTGDKGVYIYNPVGKQIGLIVIPESWTANVCFGGKSKDILFITSSKAVYTFQMKVRGVE